MESEEKIRLQHLICYGNYKDEISDNTEVFRLDTALFNAFQLLEDETVWSGVQIENKLYERIKLLIAYEVEIKNKQILELEKVIDDVYLKTDETDVWRIIEKHKEFI